jgi:hypothetical protein
MAMTGQDYAAIAATLRPHVVQEDTTGLSDGEALIERVVAEAVACGLATHFAGDPAFDRKKFLAAVGMRV